MVDDLKCAVRFMRAYARELHIDPGAIGAMGSSKRENELLSPYIHVSGDDPPFLISRATMTKGC